MKKSLIVLAAILMITLCGCQMGENADVSVYEDAFSSAQEIAVISSDTSEVIETITDAEDIEYFTLMLNAAEWELKSLPDDASEIGSFGISKQKTTNLFDVNPDETLYDVGTITLYDGAYIVVELADLDSFAFTFEVSADTAAFLNGYFEQL